MTDLGTLPPALSAEEQELAGLAFPGNLLALLQKWETGAAQHLHQGLFTAAGEDFGKAQDRALEMLLSRLPCGGKLLDVGCGLGGLAGLLWRAGADIVGIVPDEALAAVARRRFGDDLPLRCCSFEDFKEDDGRWDALLFHESGQHMAMLDLFARASALLKEDGEILILDEFACKRVEVGEEEFHHKEYFLRLATRFGFACREDVDLSSAVAPSLDFLLRGLADHAGALAAATGLEQAVVENLRLVRHKQREKYRQGRFGYFLLHLKRKKLPRWRLSRMTEADQPAVSGLFSEVFGKSLTPAFWRWKYGPGRGQAVGLWQDGRLIAHYGGIPRFFHCPDGVYPACQPCDFMVAAGVRGLLVRKGPPFLVAATFIEQFIGYGTAYPFSYTFPNERSFGLPFRLGICTSPMVRMYEASWPAGARGGSFLWTMRDIDPAQPKEAAIIDNLWLRMIQELRHLVVGVRDASYWRARYREHPEYDYRLVLLCHRWTRRPLAVVAVKVDGRRLELLDWVAGRDQLPKVALAARFLAAQGGLEEVYTWVSDPVIPELAATCARIQDIHVNVPTNAWTEAPPLTILMGKLYLTAGDTDFH
ncbi:MAG: GNAT family N-acetyltransferase [Desulfuromonadaceae bacterium]|nr:GNAT family N-acetyltransferase [Desulfuromonadaceae bacterium]NLV24094.1 GNAT family N-acetyltransferase [Deltaproteobacteria bacterium]